MALNHHPGLTLLESGGFAESYKTLGKVSIGRWRGLIAVKGHPPSVNLAGGAQTNTYLVRSPVTSRLSLSPSLSLRLSLLRSSCQVTFERFALFFQVIITNQSPLLLSLSHSLASLAIPLSSDASEFMVVSLHLPALHRGLPFLIPPASIGLQRVSLYAVISARFLRVNLITGSCASSAVIARAFGPVPSLSALSSIILLQDPVLLHRSCENWLYLCVCV